MDPYLLLEVPHAATIDDIKKAYRRLALKWHPDKNGGSKVAEEMFKKIKAAYDCLVDPIKRAAEDLKRKHSEQAEASKKAQAERQARARAHTNQPPPGRSGINVWVAVAALVALVFIIAALFGSNNSSSSSTAATL
jgi:DnaJ-class molecular chaperone